MSDDDRLIGSIEASEMLEVDRATLLRWVARGKVAAAHQLPGKNGAYLFRYSAIAKLVDRRRAAV
jgi:predicted site-specific integrase-resolvase